MRSRRHEGEHENHERWLVSYADFITLLFAFFVVMYSVSSVNEGKFRVLSSTLEDAFREHPIRGVDPIQIGEILRTLDPEKKVLTGEGILPDFRPETGDENTGAGQEEIPEGYQEGSEIVEALENVADKLEEAGFEIKLDEKWVEVTMNSQVLFGSGKARLSEKAKPVLDELIDVLNDFKNPLRVEGFTDNQPIRTSVFPSNWELSAARAASVVSYFASKNIDPQRMAAVGYGEYRPIADNSTAEGRRKNRRITVLISTDPEQLKADAEKNAEKESNADGPVLLHTINKPEAEGYAE